MNDYRMIDMNTYARRAQFEHFRTMPDPYTGVTVNVDVTDLATQCRRKGKSFTLAFLHLVSLAVNEVPELRQRIREGGIIEFTSCETSHIELLPDGTYCYCTVHHNAPGWAEYFARAERAQQAARTAPSIADGEDVDSLIFVSCVPWLHYTGLKEPVANDGLSNPHIFWGKYEEDWRGRKMMPVTVHVHHALADGFHISLFFRALDRLLAEADLSELPDKI